MNKEQMIMIMVRRGDLHQTRQIELYSKYTTNRIKEYFNKTIDKQFADYDYWKSPKELITMFKKEAFNEWFDKQDITFKEAKNKFNFDIFFEGEFVSNQDDTTYEHVLEDLMIFFKEKSEGQKRYLKLFRNLEIIKENYKDYY